MASNSLALNPSAAAIITAAGFNREQVELIKSTVAIGATDLELALFLQTAKHRGLDVFARQLHFVKRRQKRKNEAGDWVWVDVGTMLTGIDGFRAIADRTGKYDGQDEAEFTYEPDGKVLRSAKVRVYRKDMSRSISATAYWREYVQTDADGAPVAMWKKMPHLMLAKTAEALALRKAFPENLSGLYTDDEMPPIEDEAIVHDQPAVAPTGTVTRMPENGATAVAPATEAAAPAEEIPAAGSDEKTLRAWLQVRLGFPRSLKSWTGEHMGKACTEIARVLSLEADKVTPRTLGGLLPAYRTAVALAAVKARESAAEARVAAPADTQAVSNASPAPAPSGDPNSAGSDGAATPPGGDGSTLATEMAAWVAQRLRDFAIADDDTELLELTAEVGRQIDEHVTYDWHNLSPKAMRTMVERLIAAREKEL